MLGSEDRIKRSVVYIVESLRVVKGFKTTWKFLEMTFLEIYLCRVLRNFWDIR